MKNILFLLLSLLLTSTTHAALNISDIESEARSGSSDAMYKMGLIFEKGVSTNVDENYAIFWYKKASKEGVIRANARLGVLYYTKGNYKESKKYLKMGIDGGEPLSSFYYYKILEKEGDLEEANKHFKIAIAAGIPEALFEKAKLSMSTEKPNYYISYVYSSVAKLRGYKKADSVINQSKLKLSRKQVYVANKKIKSVYEEILINKRK